mgnify:CR=1 FL=1
MTISNVLRRFFVLIIISIFCCGYSQASLKITGVGKSGLTSGSYDPHELSGITYVGSIGSDTYRYLAVSNTQKTIYNLDIKINSDTGAIESAVVVSSLKLAEGTDLEGIALFDSKSVLVSDETGSMIRNYSLTDGSVKSNLTMPSILSSVRANRSLESLAVNSTNKSIWTANEEALTVDGNASAVDKTNTVRLMKFNSDFSPAGQWAYIVDSIESAMLTKELSGVSDMVILPGGEILVLERELDGNGFRSRIYSADISKATDITGYAGLIDQTYTPASKTLLWQKRFGFSDFNNYEGMCLGPKLKDGSYSILMISDDNSSSLFNQSLYSLKVAGATVVAPEPASYAVFAIGIAGLLPFIRRKKA